MQMKARELLVTAKSIDGDYDDDWQLVDCKSYVVHLLLPGSICILLKTGRFYVIIIFFRRHNNYAVYFLN